MGQSGLGHILAVITARGGSKRVVRKNLRPLGGKPLLAWTVAAAMQVKDRLCSIIVSTEDREIAAVARECGADVPFLRPTELASDKARSLPVLQHAVNFIESRDSIRIGWVLLLQPTSPFRTASDIVACIDLAQEHVCDSVISVCEMYDHPVFAKRIGADGYLVPFCLDEVEGIRRQDVSPPAFKRNGAIYLTQRDVLMKQESIYGARVLPYVMPVERSIDIDSEVDLLVAEALLKAGVRK